MMSSPQRKLPLQSTRPAYQTLQGWALGTLIEQGAVVECAHHGHRVDRGDPDAWNRAREEAWRNPFPGSAPEACIEALEKTMRGIGDTCPDC
ncbi:hypothetical protein [Bradyrhizobium sp. Leo170]|uniref:hypothetical protein n=1 Tax=Bradyrhizobium sp. Leo170 TaxID=1571199 RepID=UPI00102E985B|nr:hypothetical protein [Bradyrhizobium sp. Leo170]TAI63663.1 hypothetical protein CWO89_23085 [Bradyrhizobium sp. Leo170]